MNDFSSWWPQTVTQPPPQPPCPGLLPVESCLTVPASTVVWTSVSLPTAPSTSRWPWIPVDQSWVSASRSSSTMSLCTITSLASWITTPSRESSDWSRCWDPYVKALIDTYILEFMPFSMLIVFRPMLMWFFFLILHLFFFSMEETCIIWKKLFSALLLKIFLCRGHMSWA